MVSNNLVIGFLVGSIALVALMAYWFTKDTTSPEDILERSAAEQLEGPLTPEESEIKNPSNTNEMNTIVTLNTNRGAITLELFTDTMPVTTNNFINLAESGFYDGIKFHRVIDGFMIQAGDPHTKGENESLYGTGGPGYTIKDEFVSDPRLTNTRGTIAMANTGQPNSGGSQFFINLGDNTNLDFDKQPLSSKHPVFGRVIDGMDVVDAIGKTETAPGDLPVEAVIIESITVAAAEESGEAE